MKFIIYFLVIALSFLTARDNYYQLDELEDLELKTLDYPKKSVRTRSQDKQKLILFDDNLYLLEDDFDFGTDEIELQKIKLNPKDMETAKEYEQFLNVFFDSSPRAVGINPWKEEDRIDPKPPWPPRPPKPLGPGKLGFKVSTILGTSIPMGTNLKANFSSGSNFGVHIETPISYNLGNKEARFGADLYLSSMSSVKSGGAAYNLGNINGTISLSLTKSLELKAGLGITPATIGDYAKTLFSIPVDLNYYLPFNVKGFGLALNLHAQETLGIPNDIGTEDTAGTSEFINVGFFITTPLVF
tara:strand:+ start:1235 stop:2134 length:900 start_codon:yes stop_codon:yes gene_type:complete